MGKRIEGLTLVELSIAIAVLAIIAAMAWPSWSRGGQAARQARLEQARTQMQQAAEAVHGLASNQREQPPQDCSKPGFGPNPPSLNAAGHGNVCAEAARVQVSHLYPAASVAGIVAAAALVPGEGSPTSDQLRKAGFEVESVAFGLRLRLADAPEPSGCQFIYVPPAALGQPPSVAGIATQGC